MPNDLTDLVSVRYVVDDVDAAIDFYTKHLGFTLRMSAAPGRELLIVKAHETKEVLPWAMGRSARQPMRD